MRERRQPVPVARPRAATRADGARGHRREPRPPRPPDADRERGAVVDRRRARAGAGVGDRPYGAGGGVERFSAARRVRLDGGTIAFTAAAALVTTILSGLAPALRGARFNLAESLHGGDGASAGGFRGLRARRLREGLLVAESAFAVLLLVAATLLARSFVKLTQVDGGYTSDGVLAAEIYLPGGDAEDRGPAMNALVNALVARARAMAGTAAAGAGNMMPLDRATQIAGFPSPWTAPGARTGSRSRPAVSRDARLRGGAPLAAARRAPVHRRRLCGRHAPVDRQRGVRAAVPAAESGRLPVRAAPGVGSDPNGDHRRRGERVEGRQRSHAAAGMLPARARRRAILSGASSW